MFIMTEGGLIGFLVGGSELKVTSMIMTHSVLLQGFHFSVIIYFILLHKENRKMAGSKLSVWLSGQILIL